MSKEIRNLLLVFVTPICLLSLVMAFFAPAVFAQATLAMLCSVSLLCVGMYFLIDWFDKR